MTRHRSHRKGTMRDQRGVSLITAVFLLVMMAGLAAAMVRVYVAQQATAGMDVMGMRAYQAARAGLEWGLFQQLRVQPPSVACFSTPQTFPLPSSGGLGAFTVTVSCSAKPGNTAGDTTNRWTIVAVACNQPGAGGCPNPTPNADYVQRRLQAELN